MKREILLIQKVAIQADAFYKEGESFGKWAARALASRRSQITGLEAIANSSLKISDILDYLKKQTAKADTGKEWRDRNEEHQEFGPQLIAFIRDSLKNKRDLICDSVATETGQPAADEEKQRIHLALIREFIRQVAAHYELERTS